MLPRCALTVRSEIPRVAAICLFRQSRRDEAENLLLACAQAGAGGCGLGQEDSRDARNPGARAHRGPPARPRGGRRARILQLISGPRRPRARVAHGPDRRRRSGRARGRSAPSTGPSASPRCRRGPHREVHDDDVDPVRRDRLDGGGTIATVPTISMSPSAVRDGCQALAHHGVVVGDQDTDHGCSRGGVRSGRRRRQRVPRPGAVARESSAPASAARSCMTRVPRWPSSREGREPQDRSRGRRRRPPERSLPPIRVTAIPDAARCRVRHRIAQRFLRDAVEKALVVLGEVVVPGSRSSSTGIPAAHAVAARSRNVAVNPVERRLSG